MNKQDIFPLYVGKCKVRITKKYKGDEMFGDKVVEQDADFQAFYPNNVKFNEKVVAGYKGQTARINLDNCQLILKRISEMSDQTEIVEHDLLTGKIIHLSRQPKVIFEDLQQAINEHIFWLIEHGYALSDEWFENGIAVEAGK